MTKEKTYEEERDGRDREQFEIGFASGVYESKRAVMNAQSSVLGLPSFVYCSRINDVLCEILENRIKINRIKNDPT